MGIWLVMKTSQGEERPFRVADRITIGRETRCHVRIAVPNVCDQHCELIVENNVVRLADLGSKNGTYHNGNRVKEAILNHQDTLTIGPVTFELRVEERMVLQDHENTSSDSSITEPKPIADPQRERKTTRMRPGQ